MLTQRAAVLLEALALATRRCPRNGESAAFAADSGKRAVVEAVREPRVARSTALALVPSIAFQAFALASPEKWVQRHR